MKMTKPSKQATGTLIKLVISFIVVIGVYILIIRAQSMIGMTVFYSLTGLLLIACVILNGGLNKDIPTPEMLRDSWSEQKKQKFIAAIVKGKKLAKSIIILLLPMLVVVMIDVIYLFWLKDLNL